MWKLWVGSLKAEVIKTSFHEIDLEEKRELSRAIAAPQFCMEKK